MRDQKPIFNHPSLQLLQKCDSPKALKQIHAHMITTGLLFHTFPLSRLLLLISSVPPLFATLGLPYALAILHQFPHPPSIFLYNTLISALASHDYAHLALSLYSGVLLNDQTLSPNNFTYPSLFKACAADSSWHLHGRALHVHVLKFLGPTCDHFVQTSLLHFYSKSGKLAHSRYLFNQIQNPDLGAWNSIMHAYAHNSASSDATTSATTELSSIESLSLFNEMLLHSLVRPDEITLAALICACADLGALNQGAWAHAYIRKYNLPLNHFVGTALIDMYARCGRADLADQVFEKLPVKDTLCYNAMIRGLAVHGRVQCAIHLFDQMLQEGVKVNDVTILVVMCACAHVGWVEKGRQCFESMKEVYGIEPKIEHYGCLVDLLGRAGRLDEAADVAQKMPFKANAVFWRSLLGACRIHGNLKLGELAVANLVHLEPENGGNYVLLSNMYAFINRWDDVRRVRKVMKDKGINKMPGFSLIEMDGAVHEFMMGDRGHPFSMEIYNMLDEMGRRLHAFGHRPSTEQVLFDIDDEEKEGALSYHSERIAIAFGLLASKSSAPIRIIKNLRVCGDCHATTKLISQIYSRDIIVRDRIRFHHFRNGACSCLDYW